MCELNEYDLHISPVHEPEIRTHPFTLFVVGVCLLDALSRRDEP